MSTENAGNFDSEGRLSESGLPRPRLFRARRGRSLSFPFLERSDSERRVTSATTWASKYWWLTVDIASSQIMESPKSGPVTPVSALGLCLKVRTHPERCQSPRDKKCVPPSDVGLHLSMILLTRNHYSLATRPTRTS